MKAVRLVLASALLFPQAGAAGSCGNRAIKIGGFWNVLLSGGQGEVSPGGNAVKLSHNEFASVVSSCSAPDHDPQHITAFRLLGATFTFVVDLSRVGCACNLALYLVSAPARSENGAPFRGRGDYYCDANMVGGQWCPEVDIMEANNHAFQATPHKCDRPVGDRHYNNCDRGGCAQNTRDQLMAYGVGHEYTIDTRKPFTVSTTFESDHAGFSGFKTLLMQEGRHVALHHEGCSRDYLQQLTGALSDGMSLIFSYWGDGAQTMAWMDSPPCGAQVCRGEQAGPGIISQMRVTKAAGAPVEAPHPTQARWRPDGTTTTTTFAPELLALRRRSGTIRWRVHPERCLTVDGGSHGGRLVSSECLRGDPRQRFQSLGDGRIRWVEHPELCVSVHGDQAQNGALVILTQCGERHDLWSYPWTDSSVHWRSLPERCLDVSDRSEWNWVQIQVWDCLGDGGQAFDWVSDADVSTSVAGTTAAPGGWWPMDGSTFAPTSSSPPIPTASTSSKSPVATSAPPPPRYDCLSAEASEEWGESKRQWCCHYQSVGCETATAAPSHYDCDWGYPEFAWQWPAEKRAWCCEHEGAESACGALPRHGGGGGANVSGGSSSWVTFNTDAGSPCRASREQSGSSSGMWYVEPAGDCGGTATYDCNLNLDSWHLSWTLDQQQWCCRCCSEGCNQSLADVHRHFDCSEKFWDWQNSWTREKKDFCCDHMQRGCAPSGAAYAKKAAILRRRSRDSSMPGLLRGAAAAAAVVMVAACLATSMGKRYRKGSLRAAQLQRGEQRLLDDRELSREQPEAASYTALAPCQAPRLSESPPETWAEMLGGPHELHPGGRAPA